MIIINYMRNILESYKTPELRKFVNEHNKKVRKEISEEINVVKIVYQTDYSKIVQRTCHYTAVPV